MPLCHLVDQHTYRGIAHVLGEGAESTFALRFQSLFNKCTGFNPRLADPDSQLHRDSLGQASKRHSQKASFQDSDGPGRLRVQGRGAEGPLRSAVLPQCGTAEAKNSASSHL